MTDQGFRMPEMPDFPLNDPPAPEPPKPPVQPPSPSAASQIPPQSAARIPHIPTQPVTQFPEIPQIQPIRPVPQAQNIPSVPQVQDIPSVSQAQNTPSVPQAQNTPSVPQAQNIPSVPQVQDIPPVTPVPPVLPRPVYPQEPYSRTVQSEPSYPESPVPPYPQPPVPPQNTVPPVPHTYDDFAPDTKRILALPPITTREAESCRHRLENRWYRRLILLNVFLIMLTIGLVMTSMDDYRKQVADLTASVLADAAHGNSDDDDYEETSKADYEEFAEDLPLGFQMLGYGIALMTIGYIALYYLNAQVRSRSIKITERSFPELHALIRSYAARLGMPIPDAYIVNESGILNAFSAFLYRRQYIQINSEIVEVAYREHRDMNALAFVIAHEMAHIYYGHATLHYNVWIWFSTRLPLFSQIASRTREYSCDRLAQRLTNYDGLGAMLMLIADRHLYHMVDVQDYLNGAARESGFFIWLVNLFSDHPIMTKRIRALADWNGHGELY